MRRVIVEIETRLSVNPARTTTASRSWRIAVTWSSVKLFVQEYNSAYLALLARTAQGNQPNDHTCDPAHRFSLNVHGCRRVRHVEPWRIACHS